MSMEDITSSIACENFDKALANGAEAVRGIEEGVTSAVENMRDLNVSFIDVAQANADAAFDLAREIAGLVQACTLHAIKQFDTLTKHAIERTRLTLQFASTPEQVARPASRSSKVVPFPAELVRG